MSILMIALILGGTVFIISLILFLFKYEIGKTIVETQTDGPIIFQKAQDDFDFLNLGFSLFKRGEEKMTSNYMIGKSISEDIWKVFNYEYYSKDNNSVYNFIVAKTSISKIPNLIVQCNSCNHKIGDIFGYNKIAYENRKELNNFIFQSKDDTGAFKVFNNEFLEFLSTEVKGNIEVEDNNIIYYENSGKSVKEITLMLDKIIQLLK